MPVPIMAALTARHESRFSDEQGNYLPIPISYVVLAFGNADVAAWEVPRDEIPALRDDELKFVEHFAAAKLRTLLSSPG
jgi:hypothetical protein